MSTETEAAARPAATTEPPGTESAGTETTKVPLPKEIGGAKGPEPTRYGDWEHKGRCTDF
jgi:hypothetical protein